MLKVINNNGLKKIVISPDSDSYKNLIWAGMFICLLFFMLLRSSEITKEEGFMTFVGGTIFLMFLTFSCLRPSAPEMIVLLKSKIIYEPGYAPLYDAGHLYPIRKRMELSGSQIKTLALKKNEGIDILVIEYYGGEIELARFVNEHEKKIIFDELRKFHLFRHLLTGSLDVSTERERPGPQSDTIGDPLQNALKVLFLIYWLGCWFYGEIIGIGRVLNSPDLFFIVWLCIWTLGGLIALFVLYKSFKNI